MYELNNSNITTCKGEGGDSWQILNYDDGSFDNNNNHDLKVSDDDKIMIHSVNDVLFVDLDF